MKSQKQCLALEVKVAQLCPTLYDPMDYTVHGILQARILEWVAFPFSRESSQPRDWMSPWKCSINIDHSHCLVIVVVQLLSRVQPLRPHGLQHSRLPCPPLSPRVCSNSCPYNTVILPQVEREVSTVWEICLFAPFNFIQLCIYISI